MYFYNCSYLKMNTNYEAYIKEKRCSHIVHQAAVLHMNLSEHPKKGRIISFADGKETQGQGGDLIRR